jgi:hypothetical protein
MCLWVVHGWQGGARQWIPQRAAAVQVLHWLGEFAPQVLPPQTRGRAKHHAAARRHRRCRRHVAKLGEHCGMSAARPRCSS